MKYLLMIIVLLSAQLAYAQEDTRIFIDGRGKEVEIPVQAKRIIALRGEQFTAPLIELGAPVVGSVGNIVSGFNDGKPFMRGAYDLFHAEFGDQINFIGTSAQVDLEKIASLSPDLILVPDFAMENVEQLSAIAPTVVINIWSNPALERYRRIADAAGYLDDFERLESIYNFRLEYARELTKLMVGDPAEVSVAIAEVRGQRFRVYKNYGAMSHILDELGFSKPKIIADMNGERLDLSPEQVQAINADFLVTSYSKNFKMSPEDIKSNWDSLIPNWNKVLHAPQFNQHILIAREPMRALSFKSMEEILSIYISNIVMRDFTPLEK